MDAILTNFNKGKLKRASRRNLKCNKNKTEMKTIKIIVEI